MQQFAVASVSPRSIAWLIRAEEWNHFEKIVKYNCTIVGGYFNVIVPLTDQDMLTEEYQRFLIDYDPDLVILAPGMTSSSLEVFRKPLYPFAFIPWDLVSLVVGLDPLSVMSGMNATMVVEWDKVSTHQTKQCVNTLVAVADEAHPDTGRLAFVACGDVEPREPMWEKMDDEIDLDAFGYREDFFIRLLKPGYDQKAIETHLDNALNIVSSPDSYQLAKLILERHQFPLSGAVQILKTCCQLQHFPLLYQSFIGLTASYKKEGGTPERNKEAKYPPTMVLLMSNEFALREAILFWNLRASGVYVIWLSFSDFEENSDAAVRWLESDNGGIFYWLRTGTEIAFASSDQDAGRVQSIFDSLKSKRKTEYPVWTTMLYSDLIFYNYIRPTIRQEHITIAKDGSRNTFIPNLLQQSHVGSYGVTLEWSNLMLPRSSAIILNQLLKHPNPIEHLSFPNSRLRAKSGEKSLDVSNFRVAKNHYIRIQCHEEKPIVFNIPSPEAVIESLFLARGFSRIERSSTAKYQMSFLQCAGGLEEIAYYLSTAPYRELLELLADNTNNRTKIGWIIDKRRTLHHYYVRSVVGRHIPTETKKYFDTISDELPLEVITLLEKGILERGFKLVCRSCSFSSWYPVEQVGQTFRCTRCYQSQVYETNPLWLYKLKEVVFHGFASNMYVPFLALNSMKKRSKYRFEWVPDSDVYWIDNNNELHRNLNLICLRGLTQIK